ncbi:unnamed protein product [Paramecium primaurelia]|uniref:Transmembrane protein n=1 Tax=Paramecium primaurelia TaxID=5886 RepID=A0A8S1JR58_PARPR|nr:unnamed protein product [Paramecium primaurelia]
MLLFIYLILPTLNKALQSYFVKFGEVQTLFEIKDALDAQLVQIDDNNKIINNLQFCYLSNRTLLTEGQTFQLPSDQFKNDSLPENSDLLIDMVILGQSEIYGLTINNHLFHISLINEITKVYDLNIINEQISLPQLIGSSEYFILAYPNYAHYLDFRNLQNQGNIENWQSRQSRYYSQIIDCYLFSVIGSDGLEIYFINQNYQSYTLDKQSIGLQAVDFRDFSISKLKEMNYLLYILCKINGIIVIDLTIQNEKVLSKLLLKNIGPKNDGIAITINNDDFVFVAYKTKNQYYVIQFNIEFINKKWGSVARFNISNKIVDIGVNEKFILVQGFHTHFLIYYQDKENAIPFQLTSVKQFVLSGDYIYGTTSKYLFQFKPNIQPYQIKCFIETDSKQIEIRYKLIYRTNQGQKSREFKVHFNQKPFIIPIYYLFFILLVFLISILFYIAYRQYKNQREKLVESQQLEQKIRKLPQNRASKLLMPYTFRVVQTNIENRINTINYGDEDTILQKDQKIF